MLTLWIAGAAEPSGSKTRTKWGIRESNPSAADYRVVVASEVARAMEEHGLELVRRPRPVYLSVTFYRVRPSSHYRSNGLALNAEGDRRPWPTTKPDRGKTLRTIEDALTGVLYEDDAQVVEGVVAKRWGERAGARLSVALWENDPLSESGGRWSGWEETGW